MRQLLVISIVLGLAATPVGAASTPVPFGAAVSSVFKAASGSKLKLTGDKVPKTVEAKGGTRWERVSAYVRLSGTGHVSRGSRNVYIEVSGYETITGAVGRITSGRVRFSSRDFYYLSSNYVRGTVRISEYVSFYKNGKYLGQAYVSGSISVSGFNSNGWIRLSGSGRVSGNLNYVDESP